jgi:hypothetical protein
MSQIARHYQGQTPFERHFKLAADKAFYSIEKLATQYIPYTVVMSDDATELVSDAAKAFYGEDKSAGYMRNANQAKAAIWNNLKSMVETYAGKNDCGMVKLIFKSYQDLKNSEPVAFEMFKDPLLLEQLPVQEKIARKCPGLSEAGVVRLRHNLGLENAGAF